MVDVVKHPPIAGANAQPGKQSASSAEKTGHFGASCQSKSVSTACEMGEEEIDTEEEDFLLLGILESQGSQPWMIDVKLMAHLPGSK